MICGVSPPPKNSLTRIFTPPRKRRGVRIFDIPFPLPSFLFRPLFHSRPPLPFPPPLFHSRLLFHSRESGNLCGDSRIRRQATIGFRFAEISRWRGKRFPLSREWKEVRNGRRRGMEGSGEWRRRGMEARGWKWGGNGRRWRMEREWGMERGEGWKGSGGWKVFFTPRRLRGGVRARSGRGGWRGRRRGYSNRARSPSNDSPLFFANKSSKSCTPIFARESPPTSSTVRP